MVPTPLWANFGLADHHFPSYSETVKIRFYIDPTTGAPHIYNHQVDETEVKDVLANSDEDRPGTKNSRVAIGRTEAGRVLRVIYA